MFADPAQSFWILLLPFTKFRAAVFGCLQRGHCGYEKTGRARFPQLFAHLPAADCSFGVLRDRRATCRRVSVLAAPNRAAIDSNAGVAPFQRSWSTSSKSSISVRSVASFGKSIALSQSQQSVSARALALAAFTRHSRQSLGMDSR